MPRQEQGRNFLNFCFLPVSALDRKDAGCWVFVSHASQGESMHLYAKRLGWIGISRILGFRVPGVLSFIYCCSICACVGVHECV